MMNHRLIFRAFIGLSCVSSSMGLVRAESAGRKQAPSVAAGQVLPLFFVPNTPHSLTGKRPVPEGSVTAFLQTPGGRVLFTHEGAFFSLPAVEPSARSGRPGAFNGLDRRVVMRSGFSKGTLSGKVPVPELAEETGAAVNFLVGARNDWRTRFPAYRMLRYADAWPDIDVEYLAGRSGLECRVMVKPGADPGRVVLETGASMLSPDKDGNLIAEREGATLVLTRPVAFQARGMERTEIGVSVRVLPEGRYTFTVEEYNRAQPLVITSTIIWGTFLGGGGQGQEIPWCMAIGHGDGVYLCGKTNSEDFPTTSRAYQPTLQGREFDAFVARLSSDGSKVKWCTYLGGSDNDCGFALAVDTEGNTVVAGSTFSSDFPVTPGACDASMTKGDAFIAKLDAEGANLRWATFLGGTQFDQAKALVLDSQANVILCGETSSPDFPVTAGVLDPSHNGYVDTFLSRLSADGSQLINSTFLGGMGGDFAYSMAVSEKGDLVVTGQTRSVDFPVTPESYDTSHNGSTDLFVARLSPDVTRLVFATYLGGSQNDEAVNGLALGSEDEVLVAGTTQSPDFPVSPGAFDTTFAVTDGFVLRLSPDGSTLLGSTFLGGSSYDYGNALATDATGNILVTGSTSSTDFPVTSGAYDPSPRIGYLAKLNMELSALLWSTYLDNAGLDLGLDDLSNPIVTGTVSGETTQTYSLDVRVTKLSADGNSLIWSKTLGGHPGRFDAARDLTLDNAGNIVVFGQTASGNFPVTPGAFDQGYNGETDVFVTKMAPDGVSLIWSTYLGGTKGDYEGSMVLDPAGNIVLTGETFSPEFPVTPGAFDTTCDACYSGDAFLTKLSADGAQLLWSTFLGGSKQEGGIALALDHQQNVIVGGRTYSSDFPVTPGCYDPVFSGYFNDAFVTKLSADGGTLLWSTYLGGGHHDAVIRLVLDASGNTFLFGDTGSSDFPVTTGAFDTSFVGNNELFVARLSADGSQLDWSTFLGGSHQESPGEMLLGPSGDLFLAGYTSSVDFPVTDGAYDTVPNATDIFVSRLAGDGSHLVWSSFLGGRNVESAGDICLDASGNLVLTGCSSSPDFPATGGAFDTSYNGNWDAVVSKISEDGSRLLWSTFLGASGNDHASGVAMTDTGDFILAGYTDSPGFPVTPGTFDPVLRDGSDAWVIKLSEVWRDTVADFDNDGITDILWRNTASGNLSAWLLSRYGATGTLFLGGVVDPDWRMVGIGDLNGDGCDDILWRHALAGTLSVWLVGAGGYGGTLSPGAADPAWKIVGTSDADADGDTDIYWWNEGNGTLSLWLLDASGGSSPKTVGGVAGSDWEVLGVADFDGDGKGDILWRQACTGALAVWFVNENGFAGDLGLGIVDPSWEVVGLGDADGDLKADLFWRNDAGGMMSLWFLDENGLRGTAFVGGIANPGWQVVGIGDYDGDGRSDLLWRQLPSGALSVWFVREYGFAGELSLGIVDPLWETLNHVLFAGGM